MKKNILITTLFLIQFFNMLNSQELLVADKLLESNYASTIITENNFILFRYKENRVEVNHPSILGNQYEIVLENATVEFKNGAFYLTPLLEVNFVDGKFYEAGKDFVIFKLIEKASKKVIYEQEFKVINYFSKSIVVNEGLEIKKSDLEFKLQVKDLMTNKLYEVTNYVVSIKGEKTFSEKGNIFSAELIMLLKSKKGIQEINVSVIYFTDTEKNKTLNKEFLVK